MSEHSSNHCQSNARFNESVDLVDDLDEMACNTMQTTTSTDQNRNRWKIRENSIIDYSIESDEIRCYGENFRFTIQNSAFMQ